MPDLRQQLAEVLQGRVCVVGVGNVEYGDDGLGVRLAEELQKSEIWNPESEGSSNLEIRNAERESGARFEVIVAGNTLERHLGGLADGQFDTVLFLDAVNLGAAPGSVVLLNAAEIVARFPQVSTHKISLALLAQMIESSGRTRAWLLGVQPDSLQSDSELSAAVRMSLGALVQVLREVPAEPPKAKDPDDSQTSR